MATMAAAPQTNGVLGGSSSQPGTQSTVPVSTPSQQPSTNAVTSNSTTQNASAPASQNQSQQTAPNPSQMQAQTQPAAGGRSSSAVAAAANPNAPRPRDARTIELLLTAQGVTAYEARVPQLLLDFAYRHTSSVVSDALYLSADPYTSHAGSRPSATSGATASVPGNAGDASVSANAVQLAIASRLAYQFRGGGSAAAGGGAASKDWLMELARERNRVALPRVAPSEWGVRLPSERFVLNGVNWGLRDIWAPGEDMEDDEEEEEEDLADAMGDAMEGVERVKEEDVGGDGVEGGTMEDVFGADDGADEEMAEE